nr:alpha/beta hydrolase [Heyndrickxia oleronia]
MKKLKIILPIVIIFLVGVYFFIGNYFYNFALNANQKKDFLDGNPHLAASKTVDNELIEKNKIEDATFTHNHTANTIKISSADQLKLSARLYENKQTSHHWAIVVHGYSGNNTQMIRYIRHFYENGYNVLAPDLRGHGESEGKYIGMGWDDRKDMLLWINQIIEKDPNAEIALFGVSMGRATVMMTSGEKLPKNVKVIVEDCGYSSVIEEFTYQLDDLFHLPKFPFINAANTITKIRAGYDLNDADAVKQVAKSKTPILFIHGDNDSFVPYKMLNKVYHAAKVEKDKLIIRGAGHGEAEKVNPELYWSTLWKFVDQYI